MTYEELTTRILYEAQRGGEQAEMANLNTRSIIESIMASVLQDIALSYARGDSDKQSLLRVTHTVALTDGVGALPDEVLTSCVWGSSVEVEGEPDVGPLMSYTPWISFINSGDDRLGCYSIRGNYEFYWVDPGDVYTPGSGRTGDVEVTIASVPAIPADPTDPTGWPAEIESDVIDRAAELLRGAAIAA